MRYIAAKNAKIFFTRHGQSLGNIGIESINSPLSELGREQSSKLSGHYDCVVISPLRRCRETLMNSKITYDDLHISYNFRERIFGPSCMLTQEDKETESDSDFFIRVNAFHMELETLCMEYKNILLIGHAYFFNAWYRQGCYPPPDNANIIEIS